jgi:hypothetical protein
MALRIGFVGFLMGSWLIGADGRAAVVPGKKGETKAMSTTRQLGSTEKMTAAAVRPGAC